MKQLINHTVGKKLGMIFLILGLLTFCSSSSAIKENQPRDTIIGTWISSSDANAKWVFTSHSKTKIYYNGNLMDTFTFKIKKSQPLWGRYEQTVARLS